jgi:hypothetical protein
MSSSSSNSSALESARALQPNPNMPISSIVVVVGSELLVIPETSVLDATQSEMEGTGPNASRGGGGSAGMFLYKQKLRFFAVSPANLAFFGAGDDDVGALLHQITQGFVSVEITDEDDKQIIDCLEHVSFC